MADWYRKKSWSEDDDKDFFLRLGRARKEGRAQYLKIQAIELIDTKDESLLKIAESLIHKLFAEYPDDKFNKSSSLKALGDIYSIRNAFDEAIEYYKQAVDFELIYPQVKTQSYLDYAELVVKSGKIHLFPSIENMILEREKSLWFPIEKYKVYTILAIINKQKRNTELAQYYTDLGEKFANSETSGLRYHKHLGIVKERDSWLERLIKGK